MPSKGQNQSHIFSGGGESNAMEVESDGTPVLRGNATVWDDVQIPQGLFSFAGNSDPTVIDIQPGGSGTAFKVYAFQKNNEIFATAQIPHSYKEGSNLKFHLHWTPHVEGVNENGNLVGWKVDYSIADVNDNFPSSTTLDFSDACDGVDFKHQITASQSVSGSGLQISNIILLRIYRSDTGADDTWTGVTTAASPVLLQFDIHIEKDMYGSREEITK